MIGDFFGIGVELEAAAAQVGGDIGQVDKQRALVSDFDIGAGSAAITDAVHKILVVVHGVLATGHFRRNIVFMAGSNHLPAAAVSAHIHKPARAVKFDARRVAGPMGKLVGVAHLPGCLGHVGRIMGQFEGHDPVGVLEGDRLGVWRVAVGLREGVSAARAVYGLGRRGIAQQQTGDVYLVGAVVGRVAAGIVPPVFPSVMKVAAIEGAHRRGAKIKVVINAFGRFTVGRTSERAT